MISEHQSSTVTCLMLIREEICDCLVLLAPPELSLASWAADSGVLMINDVRFEAPLRGKLRNILQSLKLAPRYTTLHMNALSRDSHRVPHSLKQQGAKAQGLPQRRRVDNVQGIWFV
jgi:hypothetical protein